METETPTILVAEDDENMSVLIREVLSRQGYGIVAVNNGNDALQAHRDHSIALTLMDIKIPGLNGLEALEKIRARDSRAMVIIITAYGSIETAVEAMRKGAFDFVTKPFDISDLEKVVSKALATWELVSENRSLRRRLKALTEPLQLVGGSDSLKRVKKLAERVAGTDYSVLITGESGSGKSLLARLIHQHSTRRECPLINVNCAAIPANLIESELFGHEKGAFTGAVQRKIGKFERANQGTIFLDEISTLELTSQAKLLQILQEQVFERIGGTQTLQTDVRIIAATNQDLKSLVEQGRFREDLYFRLNVVPINMPALRERRDDIVPIARYLLQRLDPGRNWLLTPESAALMRNYSWPGNIREMENVLKQTIVLLGSSDVIRPECLPQDLHVPAERGAVPGLEASHSGDWPAAGGSLKEMLQEVERQIIMQALSECNANINQAARRLQVPVRTLYFRMSKLNLPLH